MKILLVEFYSRPNADYPKIAEELRRNGHFALVGALNEQGDLEWREGDKLVAIQPARLAANGSGKRGGLSDRTERIAHLRRIQDFIRELEPDVVQVNANGLYRMISVSMPSSIHFVLDIRQINEVHGVGVAGRTRGLIVNGTRGLVSRRLYDQSTFLHEAGAEKVLGPDWRRWASVVPFAADPVFLGTAKPQQRAGSESDQCVTFIYIGRFTKRRLLGRLIDAAAIVSRKTQDFRLVFMGHDEADGEYQEMIRAKGLGNVVQIKDPIPYEEVPAEVLRHDVALAYVPEIPIDWKYHPPIKILEYRALGIPIIATDFKPNHDFVENGVNGLLVENDPEDIARAMLRFIEDRPFLEACQANAAAMRECTTWDEVTQMYIEQVYAPLANGRN